MSNRLNKSQLWIGVSIVFVVSAILAHVFIVPVLFKPQITITSTGSYSPLSVEEKYNLADSVVQCIPLEILPAQYTSFGDSEGTMSIITTDVVMQVTAANVNSIPETFILRVEGGEIEDENIRMVSPDSPLDYLEVGTEYLIFLSKEIYSSESSLSRSEPAHPSYRVALGAANGVFEKNFSSVNLSTANISDESWVSLTGNQVIDNSTTISLQDEDVSLLSQLINESAP